MTRYVVTKEDKTGLYYIHREGFPWIPVFGSFTKNKAQATKMAANYSGYVTVEEYRKAQRRKQP